MLNCCVTLQHNPVITKWLLIISVIAVDFTYIMGELVWHQPCNELPHHLRLVIYSLDGDENLSGTDKFVTAQRSMNSRHINNPPSPHLCITQIKTVVVPCKVAPFSEHEMWSQSSSTPQWGVCTAGLSERGIFLFGRRWRRGSTCRGHRRYHGEHQWRRGTCNKMQQNQWGNTTRYNIKLFF